MLYKRAIKILAQLYLQNSDEEDDTKPFFSDISGLWKSIKIVSSKHWSIMNIIQWNDSWLNGILYQTLVDGDTDGNDSESLQECCRCLEEIFLGQKRVFSLIKRNAELMEIYSAFSNSLKETIKKIKLEIVEVSKDIEKLNEEISDCKDKKYKTNLSNDLQAKTQARDLLQNTIDTITHDEYNLDYIATRLGCKTIFIDAITTVLDRHMDIIKKYNIEEVKFKLGTGDAYVYDYNDEIKSYYEYSRVKSIISDARNHFPYYYVYIQFSKQSNINTVSSKKLCEIRREIGTEMGRSVLDLLKGLVSFEHLS